MFLRREFCAVSLLAGARPGAARLSRAVVRELRAIAMRASRVDRVPGRRTWPRQVAGQVSSAPIAPADRAGRVPELPSSARRPAGRAPRRSRAPELPGIKNPGRLVGRPGWFVGWPALVARRPFDGRRRIVIRRRRGIGTVGLTLA